MYLGVFSCLYVCAYQVMFVYVVVTQIESFPDIPEHVVHSVAAEVLCMCTFMCVCMSLCVLGCIFMFLCVCMSRYVCLYRGGTDRELFLYIRICRPFYSTRGTVHVYFHVCTYKIT
jgi:hypothetical protein